MDDSASSKSTRDTEVLSLLVLRTTKALLTTMKEDLDTPKGRILDRAIEEFALKILGDRKVASIKKIVKGKTSNN